MVVTGGDSALLICVRASGSLACDLIHMEQADAGRASLLSTASSLGLSLLALFSVFETSSLGLFFELGLASLRKVLQAYDLLVLLGDVSLQLLDRLSSRVEL